MKNHHLYFSGIIQLIFTKRFVNVEGLKSETFKDRTEQRIPIFLKKIKDTKKSATWTDTKKMERVTGIEPAL